MKIRILITCCILSALSLQAQQGIGIGTTSPDPSSILDITSITDGLLIPRMTYAQRTAINSPAPGLMVIQTNASGSSQSGLYYFDGSLWKRFARSDEIAGGGNNSWTTSADNQYSNLAGNVGIGNTSPTSKFHLTGNMLQESGTLTLNNTNATITLQNGGVNRAFMQLSGNNFRIGNYSNNSGASFIVRMNGTDRMAIDSTGKLGLGVTTGLTDKMVIKGDLLITNEGGPLGDPGLTAELKLHGASTALGRLSFLEPDTSMGASISYSAVLNDLYIQNDINAAANLKLYSNGNVGLNTSSNTEAISKFQILGGDFSNLTTHHGYVMLGGIGSNNLVLSNYDILARNNNAVSPLYLQKDGGPVRIGIVGATEMDTRLHITDGAEAGLSTNGFLLMGLPSGESIAMDNNDIQARNDGAPSYLKVQQSSGLGLQIGFYNTPTHPDTKLYIPSGDDASYILDGLVHIGLKSSTNLVIDENEILARNDGGPSTLTLQNDGGDLRVGSNSKLYVGTNGNVGIGTGTPNSKLDVAGHLRVVQGGEAIGIDGNNPNIGFYQNGAYKSFIEQNGSTLFLGVNGGPMRLDATQIAIGSINSNAGAYKLTVSGKVICEELKVELYNSWPDYVFADEYQLTPLHELKSFIETNHHLPSMPKAAEVEKEGFEVGEMNRLLLEKVEELTLYVIQLQAEVDALKEKTK